MQVAAAMTLLRPPCCQATKHKAFITTLLLTVARYHQQLWWRQWHMPQCSLRQLFGHPAWSLETRGEEDKDPQVVAVAHQSLWWHCPNELATDLPQSLVLHSC